MKFQPMPEVATWSHVDVRSGFEALFVTTTGAGILLRGTTTAMEGPSAWSVSYRITLDPDWRTLRVEAQNRTPTGDRRRVVKRTGADRWEVDGILTPELDGCPDVDFESSSVTNTVPVHRMSFGLGESVDAPAVFVRADDLTVSRLEQQYTLTGGGDGGPATFDYYSSTFDFRCELRYDASGLILDYPGIAVRHS